jgi:5-methylcytosine-specific restriction endonuclease McrA
MNPFIEKYHQTQGTHCWYCDRQYGEDHSTRTARGGKLYLTREHIIPKARLGNNEPKNYIGACQDCNGLKGRKDAYEFALLVEDLLEDESPATFSMYKLLPKMRDRSWKIYNKTSKLHNRY